jgi:Beta-lactamase enzyme family
MIKCKNNTEFYKLVKIYFDNKILIVLYLVKEKHMRLILILPFILFIQLTMAQNTTTRNTDDFLEKLLMNNTLFSEVMANKEAHRIQIVYTEINRDAKNKPSFKTHTYNLNHDLYFYPASTAKMPIAFLALQKLNELNIKGLDKNSIMLTDSSRKSQEKVYSDASAKSGKPSIGHYIKKLFMVSNNEANNRLYEFLGQTHINESLQKLGYTDAQIIHRLGVSVNDDDNRNTNPIRFTNKKDKLIFNQPGLESNLAYFKRNDFIGKGFYKGDSLINKPFNFSTKNKLYLDDMSNMLLSVIFPEKFSAKKRFNLSKEDCQFLYKYMSMLPTESTYPSFDSSENYDAYCKFLMYGAEKNIAIPKNIRIFNKIGIAYGFITDIAYIVDFEMNIEFALSATIHVNADEIFNDDKYEYEKIGWPFMKNLGKAIYDYELTRERKFKPNLKKFKINYNK